MNRAVKQISDKRVPLTLDIMKECLKHAWPERSFKVDTVIEVNNRMQKHYSYVLSERPGHNMDPEFRPYFSPRDMLELGVFEGHYCNDTLMEYPREWFKTALRTGKLSPEEPDPEVNYFGIKSRQSLQIWRRNGWIPIHPKDRDPRGFFEWMMRYWLGRRIPEVDEIQIRRWKQFNRHAAQVKKHAKRQLGKRQKQRQALLQWGYNCFI